MTSPVEPWLRGRKDRRDLPGELSLELLDELDDDALTRLLADNLLPRNPRERGQWEIFWALVRDNAALGDRAGDLLEDLLDTAEETSEELQTRGDEPDLQKKVDIFIQRGTDALQRLDAATKGTLGGSLRVAIAAHRDALQRAEDAFPAIYFEGRAEIDQRLWSAQGSAQMLLAEVFTHRRAIYRYGETQLRADRALWAVARRLRNT